MTPYEAKGWGPLKKDILTMARELQALLPEGAGIEIGNKRISYCESNK